MEDDLVQTIQGMLSLVLVLDTKPYGLVFG